MKNVLSGVISDFALNDARRGQGEFDLRQNYFEMVDVLTCWLLSNWWLKAEADVDEVT